MKILEQITFVIVYLTLAGAVKTEKARRKVASFLESEDFTFFAGLIALLVGFGVSVREAVIGTLTHTSERMWIGVSVFLLFSCGLLVMFCFLMSSYYREWD